MPNERTPYLQELIRFSTKATLLVPRIVLDGKIDSNDRYKKVRDSLEYLRNDRDLFVIERNLDEDFVEVTIQIRSNEDV